MKKSTARKAPVTDKDDLLPHYDFDYSKGRRNPFAAQMPSGTIAVVLEPDVASVFRSSESVNSLLRSVISAMRKSEARYQLNKKRA